MSGLLFAVVVHLSTVIDLYDHVGAAWTEIMAEVRGCHFYGFVADASIASSSAVEIQTGATIDVVRSETGVVDTKVLKRVMDVS